MMYLYVCSYTSMSIRLLRCFICFFFFNDTATTEIYTLSLHDALPISTSLRLASFRSLSLLSLKTHTSFRSEEHTFELQSHVNLVCRLLLEKKNNKVHPQQKHLSMTKGVEGGDALIIK